MVKKSKKKDSSRWLTDRFAISVVFILSFLLFANTLGHDFTLDDAIVISENEFTQKGLGGIKDIFTKDTFHGFFGKAGKDKLVSGGRYRPFTLAMFAIERSIFGAKPFFHHLINILLYSLLGIICFFFYKRLCLDHADQKLTMIIALSGALLFVAHPLHTEAVANIKGRDEIMSMLCALSALLLLIRKPAASLGWKDYLLSSVIFLVGLLSKENAITFVAVAPLAAWSLKKNPIKIALPFLASAILFMIIRTSVIGFDMGAASSMELMNNPYLKVVDNKYIPYTSSEKIATIFHTLWKYVQLLFVPWPLTHDYYPNHVSAKTFGNPTSILGLLTYIGIGFAAVFGVFRRKLWGFYLAYFLVTISIVSNIVFPIGTHMSERFVFMPSLAFFGLVPMLLYRWNKKIAIGLTVLLFVVYSTLTVQRNMIWKDNYTLFTTDAQTSKYSAKANNAAGGAISDRISNMPEGSDKSQLIRQGHEFLSRAIEVHPAYINAHLLKGNMYFFEQKYEEAIREYDICLRIDPSYPDANTNKFLALRAAGRYYGEVKQDLQKAASFLEQALQLQPSDFETNRLLGTCYGIMGNHNQAVNYFKKCAELQPNNVDVFVNLAKAYRFVGDEEQARIVEQRIQQLR